MRTLLVGLARVFVFTAISAPAWAAGGDGQDLMPFWVASGIQLVVTLIGAAIMGMFRRTVTDMDSRINAVSAHVAMQVAPIAAEVGQLRGEALAQRTLLRETREQMLTLDHIKPMLAAVEQLRTEVHDLRREHHDHNLSLSVELAELRGLLKRMGGSDDR